MQEIIDRHDIRNSLESYSEAEPQGTEGLPALAEICRKEQEVLSDTKLIHALLDITKDKTPGVMHRVSGFVKGYVRASQNLRKTGRDLIIHMTDMKENNYFTGKSPIDMETSGNSEVTPRQNLALHILGPAFLDDNEHQTFRRLGQEWNDANMISFAEEIGLADERLFSLGRWMTGLAMNCQNTLSAQHARLIIRNVESINGIVNEHHYNSVRIPDFLYERAGLEKPPEIEPEI